MREINQRFIIDANLLNSIQRMDGYSPVIFFDLGDYVTNTCTDPDLLARFKAQFERTTPELYRLHTRSFYSASRGTIEIGKFSGITISDPSINAKAITSKTETAWYNATH